MGARASAELKDATFDERWNWIVARKDEGNAEYKNKEYEGAIDGYLLALCGLGFDKSISQDQKEKVDKELKLPVLNNMALCLINQKKYARALQMLDQVDKIDKKNEKALLRKCQCQIELVNYEKANQILKELEDIAFQSQNSQFVYSEMKRLRAQMEKSSKGEQEFTKNIFKNSQGIYKEKPRALSKEEERQLLVEEVR